MGFSSFVTATSAVYRGMKESVLEEAGQRAFDQYLATEICDDITRTAIQVHGGLGFMAESEAAKLHNDAIITTIYEGTSEIQREIISREVLGE